MPPASERDPRLSWVAEQIRNTMYGVTDASLDDLFLDAQGVSTILATFEGLDGVQQASFVIVAREKEYVSVRASGGEASQKR